MLELANCLIDDNYSNSDGFDTLSSIIKFVKGKKPKHIDNIKHNDYEKYLTIACLNNQELNYADNEKMILSDNNILMVMDGASSGDVYFNDYGIVGSTLARVDLIDKKYLDSYIYFILRKHQGLIKSKNTGSAIPHTDKVFVGTLEVPIIEKEEQEKYKKLVDKLLEIRQENQTLTQLRDTLLPKLMNGEIDLEKIEI